MKKFVHDLSPLVYFLATAALASLIAHQLIVFVQQILETTPGFELTRS